MVVLHHSFSGCTEIVFFFTLWTVERSFSILELHELLFRKTCTVVVVPALALSITKDGILAHFSDRCVHYASLTNRTNNWEVGVSCGDALAGYTSSYKSSVLLNLHTGCKGRHFPHSLRHSLRRSCADPCHTSYRACCCCCSCSCSSI